MSVEKNTSAAAQAINVVAKMTESLVAQPAPPEKAGKKCHAPTPSRKSARSITERTVKSLFITFSFVHTDWTIAV